MYERRMDDGRRKKEVGRNFLAPKERLCYTFLVTFLFLIHTRSKGHVSELYRNK